MVKVPEFCCPITTELIEDPVVAADGHTYEGVAIVDWFKTGNDASPVIATKLNYRSI